MFLSTSVAVKRSHITRIFLRDRIFESGFRTFERVPALLPTGVCRFIGAGVVRGERRVGGTDQRVPTSSGDAAHTHRGARTELRGVEAIRRRTAISTHQIDDQTCHSKLTNIAAGFLIVIVIIIGVILPISFTTTRVKRGARLSQRDRATFYFS